MENKIEEPVALKKKKIRNMSLHEIENRMSHCVNKNQTNSRYFDHLVAAKKKKQPTNV